MFSPSKSYSYLIQKQPQNMVSFKEETLSLLRQQSQKMRQLKAFICSKDEELMIKDEQIKFLKETIRQLEDEGQVLIGEKNEMKQKLLKIVEQVKNYNMNVVKPICEQKQQFKKANQLMKQVNQELQKSLSQATTYQSQSQSRLKSLTKQLEATKTLLKQNQIKCFQLQKKLQKQSQTSSKHIDELLKITYQLNLQSLKRSKLQTEVSALNKQLTTVINKHNSSINEYQLKMNQLQHNRIDISEVLIYQELVKTKESQLSQIKNQIIYLNKSNQQTKFKFLSEKDKHIKEIVLLKINYSQILTDLTTLKKSIELDKKIVEFQSQQSDLFYTLYEKYEKLTEQNSQLNEKHQQVLTKNQKLSRDVQKLSQKLKDCQIQETLMKTQLQQELQRLQSTYQGKLVSLNLKIRKEQQALERLKKKQLQAMEDKQHLCHQLQTIQLDFTSYRQTTQKSLQKLNAQNYRIVNEMQEIYKICEENVDNKRIVDRIKHVIHALLTGLYYFQHKILRNKEKQRKIYLPLVNSYLTLSKKLSQIQSKMNKTKDEVDSEEKQFIFRPSKQHKNSQNVQLKSHRQTKSLRKFRIAVYVVIGSIRIKKGLQKMGENERGSNISILNLKLLKAINTRKKTYGMNELIEREEEAYTNNEQPQIILSVLLKNTQKAFKWTQSNFKHLTLNSYQHLITLAKIQSQILQPIQISNQLHSNEQFSTK